MSRRAGAGRNSTVLRHDPVGVDGRHMTPADGEAPVVADTENAYPLARAEPTVAEVLARDEVARLRLSVAEHHPRHSENVSLSVSGIHEVECRAALLPRLPTELLEHYATRCGARVSEAIATRSDLPDSVLAALRDMDNVHVQHNLLDNKTVGVEHLGRADMSDPWTRAKLAARADLPEGTYRALAEYDDMHDTLAAQKHTPPDVLSEIAATGKYGFALCSNPSTPPEAFAGILRAAPWQAPRVAANPAATHLVEELSRNGRTDVRVAVAMRPDTPSETIARLSADRSPKVRVAAAQHEALTDTARAKLLRSRSGALLAALARNPNLPDADYDRLVRSGTSEVGVAAAAMERTSIQQFEHLWTLGDETVEVALATSKHTPEPILRRLAAHGGDKAIYALSARPDAPPEAVRRLADHPYSRTRVTAAGSPAADTATLLVLALDKERTVRFAAARHPNMPAYAIAAWAALGTLEERTAAAENPRADSVSATADRDAYRPGRPAIAPADVEKLQHAGDPTLASLALNASNVGAAPSADDDTLFAVAQRLLLWAAGDPATSLATLHTIGTRQGVHNLPLRIAAGHNPATPHVVLLNLARDRGEVKAAVAANPAADGDVLATLRHDLGNSTGTEQRSQQWYADLCATVACHHNASTATRRRILRQDSEVGDRIRAVVLRHPSPAPEAIELIAEHLQATHLAVGRSSAAASDIMATLSHPLCPATLADAVGAATVAHNESTFALVDALWDGRRLTETTAPLIYETATQAHAAATATLLRLAESPETPPHILAALATAEPSQVSAAAQRNMADNASVAAPETPVQGVCGRAAQNRSSLLL